MPDLVIGTGSQAGRTGFVGVTRTER
jgi:hypothetical protein